MTYKIYLSGRARTRLAKYKGKILHLLSDAIDTLKKTPRPRDSKKLHGRGKEHTYRVKSYRIIYEVDDKNQIVLVLNLGDRKDIY